MSKIININTKYYAHKDFEHGSKEEFFRDIHSCKETTRMYDPGKQIFEVSVKHKDGKGIDSDYWGWKNKEEDHLTMIYKHKIIFSVCFPYGLEAEEKAGRGNAVPLEVKEIGKVN